MSFDLKINLSSLADQMVRSAFENIQRSLLKALFLNGDFRLIDFTFTSAGSTNIAHGLGVVPLDIISLYTTPGLLVNVYYWKADTQVLPVNVNQGGRWRAIVGNFKGV